MPRLRLALAQTNPIVGDRAHNVGRLLELAQQAYDQGSQVFLTGELALTGYPIEDLALRNNFLEISRTAVTEFARALAAQGMGDMAVIVGHPDGPFSYEDSRTILHHPARAKNCASVLAHGQVVGTYAKHHLPNYAVFDEFRTFIPGDTGLIVRAAGVDIGIVICEDLWRSDGPVESLTGFPLGLLLVPNASPFERDKDEVREPLVVQRAKEMSTHIAYVNLVGGQDDLVFDGDSMIVDPQGTRLAWGRRFEEDLIIQDLDLPASAPGAVLPPNTQLCETELREAGDHPLTPRELVEDDDNAILWRALVTGTRDYVEKNGFPSVMMGLSGGIDSAVCATIAVDALGPSRVFGVSLPSIHSSDHSLEDARLLAATQGIPYRTESIAEVVGVLDSQLELTGLAAENVQARARAIVLMALSNKEGHLILTTGNKSELAVGYSTIYGDSVGGYAPIKDVPKTLVWELARWRNLVATAAGEPPPIPVRSIDKVPSAELRPGQTDQDSLPDYGVLDAILELLVVEGLDVPRIVARGFDQAQVEDIVGLVSRAEWKRRQGAIGPRISSVAFGRDRRLPITSRPTPFTSSR
jgi:NAD+ synthase (glutamine-hydrolysing)